MLVCVSALLLVFVARVQRKKDYFLKHEEMKVRFDRDELTR